MSKFFLRLYEFSFVLLFLSTTYFYYLWKIPFSVLFVLNLGLFFLAFAYGNSLTLDLYGLTYVVLLFLVYFLVIMSNNITGIFGNASAWFVYAFLLLQHNNVKKDILFLITKTLVWIFVPSMIAWVVVILLKINLPHTTAIYNDGQYVFNNYFIFLDTISGMNLTGFSRYHSLFLEPGHIGVLSVFVLAANNFDFKRKDNRIILYSTLLTLSLAAYILLFVVFITKNLRKGRIKYLVGIGFCLVGFFVYFSQRPESVIYYRIIARLEFKDGKLAGDNRVRPKLDRYYYNTFLNSDDKLLGIGSERYLAKNFGPAAGYKVYLLQRGFLGTCFILLFYFLIAIHVPPKQKKESMLFFFVWLLGFIQAAYPLWGCQLIVFICGNRFYEEEIEGLVYNQFWGFKRSCNCFKKYFRAT